VWKKLEYYSEDLGKNSRFNYKGIQSNGVGTSAAFCSNKKTNRGKCTHSQMV
jgi:hypothetical protein